MEGQDWKLGYLYVSVANTDAAIRHYTEVLGAKLLWRHARFGAVVAALQWREGDPILLLNDHHPPPRVQPVFVVPNAAAARDRLARIGASSLSPLTDGPTGDLATFEDLDGNPFALIDEAKLDQFLRAVRGR